MNHGKLRGENHWLLFGLWLGFVLLNLLPAQAKTRESESPALQHYLQTLLPQNEAPSAQTTGSLWVDNSPVASLTKDVKARQLHDLVTIVVAEQTLAQAAGDVTSQRDYSASSGLSALGGRINTAGVSELFSPHSSSALKGKGQSNSNSLLRTTLTAEVVALFPNGNMVVEARRSIAMNNEHREVILRGIVRPTDLSSSNAVSSTALAHLEVELKGKGVVSDGTRPNNFGVRWLWKVLGF